MGEMKGKSYQVKDTKGQEIENLKLNSELAERHYDLEKLAYEIRSTLEKELEAAKAEADETKELQNFERKRF